MMAMEMEMQMRLRIAQRIHHEIALENIETMLEQRQLIIMEAQRREILAAQIHAAELAVPSMPPRGVPGFPPRPIRYMPINPRFGAPLGFRGGYYGPPGAQMRGSGLRHGQGGGAGPGVLYGEWEVEKVEVERGGKGDGDKR